MQHYRTQQALTRRAAQTAQAWWARLDSRDLTGSWDAGVGSRVVSAVAAGQLLAASTADRYVAAQVAEQNVASDLAGSVNAQALAGVASDGRDLASLLYLPVITTKQQIGSGSLLEDSLRSGLAQMLNMVSTQVQDAGRAAAGVALTSERAMLGYSRRLNPPSCSRCAVLAGRVYRWNQGFRRHNRCDCVHVPLSRDEFDRHETSVRNDPRSYFNSLSRTDQDGLFTQAGAEAIRSGADISQVVNARRGMTTAGTTTEGTTRRGVAGNRLGASRGQRAARLMPERIYELAAGDRDEAIRLLARNGYLL